MAKLYNMKSAYPELKTLYELEPDMEDFEDLAMDAWDKINNKHTRLYRYIGDADETGKLDLPCNVDIIEAVYLPVNDAQLTTSMQSFINYPSIYTEHYIERWKHDESPFYNPGRLTDYKEGNDCLYFAHPYKHVCVLYHGVLVDEEDGLPLINTKEKDAIVNFVASALLFRDGLRKRDTTLVQFSDKIKADWPRLCNAARIPEHLSQNDMNEILDVKTRWSRKMFRKSFKPMM